jgi:hypothetical protein
MKFCLYFLHSCSFWIKLSTGDFYNNLLSNWILWKNGTERAILLFSACATFYLSLFNIPGLGEICYNRPVQNTAQQLCVPWNHCRESHTFLMAIRKITFTRVRYSCVTFSQKRLAGWNLCTMSHSMPLAGSFKSAVCFSQQATLFRRDITVSAVNSIGSNQSYCVNILNCKNKFQHSIYWYIKHC